MNLLNIKLKNYLSYKSEEKSFDGKDGLYLIIGRNSVDVDETEGNGSGKTALISSIPFALYGRSRGTFDKELVNEDVIYIDNDDVKAKKATVEIIFGHNSAYYKVTRTVNAKGGQAVTLHSSLTYPTKTWNDLTLKAGLSKRTEKRESGIFRTEQKIIDILGCDVDLFINSVYFEQSNIDTFATGSLNEKDSVIRNAIGINRWMDYGKEMSIDLSATDKDINRVKALIDDYGNVDDLKDQIVNAKESVKGIDSKLSECILEIEEKKENIETLTKRLAVEEEKQKTGQQQRQKIQDNLQKQNNIEDKINVSDTHLSDARSQIKLIKSQQETKLKSLEEVKLRKQNYDGDVEENTDDDINKSTATINTINTNIGRTNAEMESIEKQIQKVEKAECPLGLDCKELTPESKQQITDNLMKDYKKQKFNKRQLKIRRENGNTYIEKLQKQLKAKREYVIACKEEKVINEMLESVDERIKDCVETIERISEYQKTLIEDYATLDGELVQLKENVKDIENNMVATIKDTLSTAKMKLSSFENAVDELKSNKLDVSNLIKKYNATIEKTKDLRVEFNELQTKRNIIKESQAIVRKEIPHLLIGNAIPEIKRHARRFIYKISNGGMDIDFKLERELKSKDDKANAFDIFINVNGKWLKYAQTSGGQRARADVAIHLAYICFMSNMTKTKFETIFLDEVGAALDKSGVENFVAIIKDLLKEYNFKKIFNITQNIEMKKMIDNRMLITLTDEGSKISVV